ncbi:MAG: cytochrome b/b6 domain-containing protein [Sandaracinaceae bacterium]|nr:cytochrome b/b6 domain-containing protein [Sandaracinaceae bacterium]
MGHNPGSSVAIWAMLGLTLGLGVSGALMSSNEALEEVHEVLAYALLAVVVTHVAGVTWHTLRHRENITASMVSGYKEGEPEAAIPSVHPLAAAVFLVLTAAWAGLLVQGYDAATRTVTLPLVGARLQLGEGPEGGGGGAGEPSATRAEEAEEEEDDD